MTNFKLQEYPSKPGYFLDNGIGAPIRPQGHIFRFNFSTFQCSDTYSVHRPHTFFKNEKGERIHEIGEESAQEHFDLRIDMIPDDATTRYSYIGSRSFIKKFTLIISELEDDQNELQNPNLTIYHNYNLSWDTFGVFLYLDKERIQMITQRIINNEVNFGALTFSVPDDKHLVFKSDLDFDRSERIQMDEDLVEKMITQNIHCSYPYKILPSSYYDYDKNLITPYDDEPITEFDLTLGKTVRCTEVEKDENRNPEVQQIIDEYVKEWMWIDPDFELDE